MYSIGLEHEGFQVETAGTSDELFAALGNARSDVLITEWEHLGLPGLEIVNRVRSIKPPLDIPILILTNHDGDIKQLRQAAIDAGANYWLVKATTTPHRLAATVRSALD